MRNINRFEITIECEGEISQWRKELRVGREEGLAIVGAVSPYFTMFWNSKESENSTFEPSLPGQFESIVHAEKRGITCFI